MAAADGNAEDGRLYARARARVASEGVTFDNQCGVRLPQRSIAPSTATSSILELVFPVGSIIAEGSTQHGRHGCRCADGHGCRGY